MRVMVMVKATKATEAGELPSEKRLTEMGKFNEELVKAGVILAGEGLHPSSKGVRIRFSGRKRSVIDGPFPETKELVAGYRLIEVASLDRAIEIAARASAAPGIGGAPIRQPIEVRQVLGAPGD